jgi:hypothetical protein
MRQFGRAMVLLAAAGALALGVVGCETESSDRFFDNGNNNGNDEKAKIVGVWNVTTPWRWSQMTFRADGTRGVVERSTGRVFSRGTWDLVNGKMVVVSDVTEQWDYAVTATTLTVYHPSGGRLDMVRVQ